MASIQRLVISVLLILTVTFVFFAQTTEATKGPKVTHKVHQHWSSMLWTWEAYELQSGLL
jgi:hypothetical protein